MRNIDFIDLMKKIRVITDSDPWQNFFLEMVKIEIEQLRDKLETAKDPCALSSTQAQIRVWRRLLTLDTEIHRLIEAEAINAASLKPEGM